MHAHRRVQHPPAPPAIAAYGNAGVRAGKNGSRVRRINRDRGHFAIPHGHAHRAPPRAAVVALEDPPLAHRGVDGLRHRRVEGKPPEIRRRKTEVCRLPAAGAVGASDETAHPRWATGRCVDSRAASRTDRDRLTPQGEGAPGLPAVRGLVHRLAICHRTDPVAVQAGVHRCRRVWVDHERGDPGDGVRRSWQVPPLLERGRPSKPGASPATAAVRAPEDSVARAYVHVSRCRGSDRKGVCRPAVGPMRQPPSLPQILRCNSGAAVRSPDRGRCSGAATATVEAEVQTTADENREQDVGAITSATPARALPCLFDEGFYQGLELAALDQAAWPRLSRRARRRGDAQGCTLDTVTLL